MAFQLERIAPSTCSINSSGFLLVPGRKKPQDQCNQKPAFHPDHNISPPNLCTSRDLTMCEKQPYRYRCGHEKGYKLIDCGCSALCIAENAKSLEPKYVDGECGTCKRLAEEALPSRKDAEAEKHGCCAVL
ncbi:hypothetical protein GJ744_000125 [Endocarpon pusillum]|uniref:Uncharacterized protein n=1 Tax=Endocarpon pusillum TaxID=364733 RepID=A0A8H7B072_9EURO|nr:hypothetical protein GJ744_000125 [Endocarpon pusillum]